MSLGRTEQDNNKEYLEGWENAFATLIDQPLKRHLGAEDLRALALTSRSCYAAYQSKLDQLTLLDAAKHRELATVVAIYRNLEAKYDDAWLLLLPVIEYALYSGDFTGGSDIDEEERIRINSYLYNCVLKLIPTEHLAKVLVEVKKYIEHGTQYGCLLSAYDALLKQLNVYNDHINEPLQGEQLIDLNSMLGRAQLNLGHFGLLWYARHMQGVNSTLNTPILSRDIFVYDLRAKPVTLKKNELGKRHYLFHHPEKIQAEAILLNRPLSDIDSQINGVAFFIDTQKLIMDVLVEELEAQAKPGLSPRK